MRLAVFLFHNKGEKTSQHLVFKKVCDKINLKDVRLALSMVYFGGDEKNVP